MGTDQTVALDIESTGLSVPHGARPFFVSVYQESTGVQYWEWPVDPLTRKVKADPADIAEIQGVLDGADRIVGHNLKFDIRMLAAVGITVDWDKTDDTIVAAHVVDSSAHKDLTAVVWEHLGIDIKPHEDGMREVVLAARRIVQQARLRVGRYGPEEHTQLCDWLIAEDGLVDPEDSSQMMPGDNKEHWRADGWLPHALATSGFGGDYLCDHPSAADRLREYGGCDTMATYKLWVVLKQKMINKGLWDLYRFQMRLPEISARMEDRGIGVISEQVIGLTKEYQEEAERLEAILSGIADQYDYPLVVPRGTKSKSLDTFLFDPKYLNLPVVKRTEKGNPSFDADARERYEDELPRGKLPHLFVSAVERRQVLTKAVGTLEGYGRFMIKTPDGRWVMHSSLNQTGTKTLQWSSNNPNQQNASKQGRANLRRTFGPGPGRIWYSLDAQNIQLRVPAYECDERELVDVFDHPEREPYYGSYHLVIFDVVHPDLFAKHGKECKSLFEDTHYQWVKNANFCVPMDTRALTRNGWKTYDEIRLGEEVAGYKGGVLVWTPVRKKYQFKDAPLIKMSNWHFEATTTPEHRWVGTRRRDVQGVRAHRPEEFTTADVMEEHRIILSAEMQDEPRTELTPAEAAVIALVYTDGSIVQSKYVGAKSQAGGKKVMFLAKIHQSKTSGIEYIKDTVEAWGGRSYTGVSKAGITTWYLNPTDARALWKKAGLKFGTAKFDQDFEDLVLRLGTQARKEFLRATFVAEGWTDRKGGKTYGQNEGPFADAIRLAVFLCGDYPTQRIATKNGLSDKDCLQIRACKPFVNGTRIIKEDAGRGDVWCIETDIGSWVMRQGDRITLTGNCRQFGGQEKKVDATFRVKGAYRKIARRFPKIDKLNRHYVDMAVKRGYVETIPDRDIDPKRGYPLQVPRNEWDGVEPTKPFCYHVAGTAQQWMRKAMIRCEEQLVQWRAEGFDAWMIAQVHDELVFDTPDLGHPIARIISGGQIGADQGGLQIAKAYGVPTGGYIGRGYKTLMGSDPSLSKYGLVETGTDHYPERTHMNVAGSNGTIRFATDFNSPGERCTLNAIRQYNKPHYDVDLNNPPSVEGVCRWIRDNEVVTLNVAGNAGDIADKGKKVADKVYGYLAKVLTALDPLTPYIISLKKIMTRCGDGIGIPTPCSVERHSENWAKSVVIA